MSQAIARNKKNVRRWHNNYEQSTSLPSRKVHTLAALALPDKLVNPIERGKWPFETLCL